jgi:hypothetical protein
VLVLVKEQKVALSPVHQDGPTSPNQVQMDKVAKQRPFLTKFSEGTRLVFFVRHFIVVTTMRSSPTTVNTFMSSTGKIPGLPTEQPPEIDIDEEGSPLNPEEGVLRSPKAAVPKEEVAGSCEDIFCETLTVDESPLMKLTEEERHEHLIKTQTLPGSTGTQASGR